VTSTNALANSTLPYVLALAERGVLEATRADPGLRLGVNVAAGVPTHPAVARSVGQDCVDVEAALGAAVG
jgi:alanine dehydrogenase